jgi:hypothetical protein
MCFTKEKCLSRGPNPDLRSVSEASSYVKGTSLKSRKGLYSDPSPILKNLESKNSVVWGSLENLPKVQFPDPNESDIISLVQGRGDYM